MNTARHWRTFVGLFCCGALSAASYGYPLAGAMKKAGYAVESFPRLGGFLAVGERLAGVAFFPDLPLAGAPWAASAPRFAFRCTGDFTGDSDW
jgi:hypothetical protein